MSEVIWNQNKFKVGDEVIVGAYEDEQISVAHLGKTAKILEVKAVNDRGTSGQWVKSSAQPNEWVDAHWFTLKKTPKAKKKTK
jgi:hypothetical protein